MSLYQPETPEERKARHLRICQELAELGMGLARAAANRAQQELAAPEPPASGEPTPTPARARHKPADPAALFTRLCNAVRQVVALEARIATGHAPPALRPHADPRRDTLRRIFQNITAHNPNHAEINRQIDERIDHDLALDPEGKIHLGDHLATIQEDLALDVNFSKLPDALLNLLVPFAEDDENIPTPTPHAINPPPHPNGTGPPPLRTQHLDNRRYTSGTLKTASPSPSWGGSG